MSSNWNVQLSGSLPASPTMPLSKISVYPVTTPATPVKSKHNSCQVLPPVWVAVVSSFSGSSFSVTTTSRGENTFIL